MLQKQEQALRDEIRGLQDLCKHGEAVFEYRGSSGNYDPSADGYWKAYTCPECTKQWSVDQ